MYKYILIMILSSHSTAFASHCTPLEHVFDSIREEVFLCEDNSAFVNKAENCLANFDQVVKRDSEPLIKALNAIQTAAPIDAQNKSLDNTQSTYAKSINKLVELIKIGKESRDEIVHYQEEMIWPLSWSDSMGPFPGINSKEVQQIFQQEFCYGDNREGLDDVIDGFTRKINELERVKLEAAKKFGFAQTDNQNLGVQDKALLKGNSPNDKSEKGLDLKAGGISGPRSEEQKTK